jgi:hypothetical protein
VVQADLPLGLDPCVVHQHIDPAEFVDDALDERARLLGLGEVGLQRQMGAGRKRGDGVVGAC